MFFFCRVTELFGNPRTRRFCPTGRSSKSARKPAYLLVSSTSYPVKVRCLAIALPARGILLESTSPALCQRLTDCGRRSGKTSVNIGIIQSWSASAAARTSTLFIRAPMCRQSLMARSRVLLNIADKSARRVAGYTCQSRCGVT